VSRSDARHLLKLRRLAPAINANIARFDIDQKGAAASSLQRLIDHECVAL